MVLVVWQLSSWVVRIGQAVRIGRAGGPFCSWLATRWLGWQMWPMPWFRGFPHLRDENFDFAQFLVFSAAKCERNVVFQNKIFEYVCMLK